ncbi:hypothetical protein BJV78DRAFT_1191288 [Lactifluus subvellereus]|nr:hypothetical protein BJV78DRAFT_1191288 [Lactifluus subvellereus]
MCPQRQRLASPCAALFLKNPFPSHPSAGTTRCPYAFISLQPYQSMRACSAYCFPGKRGPPSTTSMSSATPSRQGANTMSSRTSAPASATPPIGAYERFNWSDEQEEAPPTPTASSTSVNLVSDRYKSPPHRGRGRDPDGPVEPDQHRPRRTTAAAMENLFDDDDDSTGARPRGVQEGVDNDSDAGEPQTRIRRGKEDWFCIEHGPMCSPGICKARAKHERDIRWAEEKEEREKQKEERMRRQAARRGRNPGRRGWREAGNAEGDGAPRNKPPRSANNFGGGCRSNSSGSSGSDDSSGADGFRVRSQGVRKHLTLAGRLPPDERENTASPEHREEDWTTGGVLWDGADDARSTASSARRAWSEAGEGDETQSVASARTNTTGRSNYTGRSAVSVRTTASDASANASPVDLTAAAVAAHAARTSPTGKRQPASDTRSVASAHTSTTVWSNHTGVSRRTGASSAKRSAASASTTASDVLLNNPTVETPISLASVAEQKGFPAFAHTTWGDTITKAQAGAKKKRNRNKSKKVAITQLEQPPLLEVELPPGGPGNWGDSKVNW